MSKIICDVCGTSYPDTADQCPICGCVRSVETAPLSEVVTDRSELKTGTYIYTKGGRFSKTNVNKRNRGINTPSGGAVTDDDGSDVQRKNDKGLIIAIVALIIAIIGVVAFIVVRYLNPESPMDDAIGTSSITQTTDATTIATTAPTTEPETTALTEPLIPCDEISVANAVIEFDSAGESVLLNISFTPIDTNEPLILVSSDERVATVSEAGVVTAVSGGEAVITVSCGEATAECRVVCTFEGTIEPTEETTEPTEETTEPQPTEYDPSLLKLDWRYNMPEDEKIGDVTMTRGTTWQSYSQSKCKIPASSIDFSSTNTAVATIDESGLVTAVGSGQAFIKATYGGRTVECRIICP